MGWPEIEKDRVDGVGRRSGERRRLRYRFMKGRKGTRLVAWWSSGPTTTTMRQRGPWGQRSFLIRRLFVDRPFASVCLVRTFTNHTRAIITVTTVLR